MRQADPADPQHASFSRSTPTMTSPRPRRASAPESYAVIGGEGFLGAALVSELLERHPASNVASFGLTQRRFDTPSGGGDPYRFFRTDITSYESILSALRDSAATTVFHTASPHAKSTPEVWRKVNIEGTDAVVRACREAGVRKLVFTSSMTVVYEPSTPYKNVDERLPIIETEEKVATYAGSKVRLPSPFMDSCWRASDPDRTCSAGRSRKDCLGCEWSRRPQDVLFTDRRHHWASSLLCARSACFQ